MPGRDTIPRTCRITQAAAALRAAVVLAAIFTSLPAVGLLATPCAAQEPRIPVARAFVFPIGDEFDFKKPAAGEPAGYHVSDPYLAVRGARKNRPRRVHYGVDLSCGQGGRVVRAIAAGIVDVSDGNAMVKVRKAKRVKVPATVKGKRTHKWGTKYVTVTKWRNGWGNRVVLKHILPDGQVVYSLYAHLMQRSVLVKKGDVVAAGQPIAKVGRTGRASAPHLHLEIRTKRLEDNMEVSDPDDAESDEEGDSGRETESTHTVDPLAFLVDHVLRFDDLEPGSWEARYAMAAAKDGIMGPARKQFDPDDEISKEDFYSAIVTTFNLGSPFTKDEFSSNLDALIDTGILDSSTRSEHGKGDKISGSDALELVLRCLDHGTARGQNMAKIPSEQLARDFNVEFAGKEAAVHANQEAIRLAAAETAAKRKAAAEREERRAKYARERNQPPPARKKTKIEAVKPVPMLDPGFESLAQSKKNLSRAQACLLIASALRLGSSNLSALERAATRAMKTG